MKILPSARFMNVVYSMVFCFVGGMLVNQHWNVLKNFAVNCCTVTVKCDCGCDNCQCTKDLKCREGCPCGEKNVDCKNKKDCCKDKCKEAIAPVTPAPTEDKTLVARYTCKCPNCNGKCFLSEDHKSKCECEFGVCNKENGCRPFCKGK